MKKVLNFILISILILFLTVFDVKALENDSILKTEYIDNVWSFHYRNGKVFTYGQLPFRYQNGNLVYCIDPPTPINTNVYSSYDDFGVSGYTEEEKKQMELIVHYGYQYEGHNTLKYYMATQELIWLFSPDEYIKWTVGNTSNTEEINIEKEKSEILSLVNKHNITPSFSSSCYTQYLGDKLTINDDNNVISNYNINSDLDYRLNGSSITFNINKLGTHTVSFNSKSVDNKKTIVYKSNGIRSQMMASFGFNDSKNSEFTIVSDKVNVRINKRDINTKDLIKDEGTIFKIKDLDNNKYIIEDLKVDKDGYAITTLPKGKYEIEETSASNGYVVNKNNTIIEINDDINLNGSYFDVDIFNDVPKGKINILKVNEDNFGLEGVQIGLYDKEYNLLKTIVTDKDGIYEIDGLILDTYYLKEISTIEGYILDDSYHKVNLRYKDDTTYIVEKNVKLVNEKIKCDIVYISTDEKDNSLKDVEINVYNAYGEIVYNGKTDNFGKITIEDLPYGNYYIKQVKVPSGYIINDEIVEFSVSDISCLSDIKVQNEKTVMPVTSTSGNIAKNIIPLVLIGILIVIKKIV